MSWCRPEKPPTLPFLARARHDPDFVAGNFHVALYFVSAARSHAMNPAARPALYVHTQRQLEKFVERVVGFMSSASESRAAPSPPSSQHRTRTASPAARALAGAEACAQLRIWSVAA